MVEELQEEHPTWVLENVAALSEIRNPSERIWVEALLEERCRRCGFQMGEHRWGMGRFNCPDTFSAKLGPFPLE